MSFEKMTVPELKKVAEQTGVDLGEAKKKAEIIDALGAEGVTYDYYLERFVDDGGPVVDEPVEPTPAPKVKDVTKASKTVLRLVTGWAHYETEWGIATQASPFILVDASQVPAATKSGDFRVATAEEVAEAYGLKK